ncbi:endonuclease III [Candidatus Woesearchaeota archaeon]|nr:endonuclease III [Candidatus Woesearchaeota archaeon]
MSTTKNPKLIGESLALAVVVDGRRRTPPAAAQRLRAQEIYQTLKKLYPDTYAFLKFNTPFECLVAVMLSAQCTDVRVNMTTPALFARYKTVNDYAQSTQQELESYIKSCGFYHTKAKHIIATAKILVEKHRSKVPATMEKLLELPGVARKTANIVLGNAHKHHTGIAVDTHVKRVSTRLGLTRETNTDRIEQDLLRTFRPEQWWDINYLFIRHGRETCKAPTPFCSRCALSSLCPRNGITKST